MAASTYKPSILMTIRQGKIGGGESHVLSLVSRLDRNKFRPVVVSFTDGEMTDRLRDMGVSVYVVPTTKPFNPLVRKQLNKIIQEEEIDLVHAHGTRAASNSYHSAHLHNLPLVYTVHGWSFHPGLGKLMFRLRTKSEKFLCGKATQTICVSHANQTEGKKLFELDNSVVISNGVDLTKFNAQGYYPDIRQELSISDEKFLVGYIVRMTKQKNPLVLLEAIKLAYEQEPKLHFLLVGTGELKQRMLEFIDSNNLDEAVTFLDFRTDVPAILSAVDLYVLPSLWEGLPIGVMEAMAMQKACLVSDIPANCELITDETNGWTVPNDKPAAIAEKMVYAAQNPQKARALGKAALETVVQNYTLDPMVKQIEGLYISLLAQSK
jgi:glycosyltransferase involved in cell wall biosynthesis